MSRRKSFNKAAKKDEVQFQIFSDLDGVLTDFDGHAKAHDKFDAKGNPKWDALDLKWWSSMPAYEGAKEFYDALRARGRTRMLTAPIMNADSFRGKAEWAKEFRRSRFALLDLIIAKAEDKNLLARPHHILVDDREKNIDAWVKAGGIGILHKGDYADTLKRIDDAMAQYRRDNDPALPPAPPALEDPAALKVFIGTNGVLADFQTHLETENKIDATGNTKWTALDAAWWKSIPAFDGAKKFYEDVKELVKDAATGKSQVRFLTGPVPTPDSFEGDAEWTIGFRPEAKKFALLDIIIARSGDKELLARPNNILIDDRQKNIDAWVKAGGIGILHNGDFADTLLRLKQAVQDYRTPKRAILPMKPLPPNHP
ncbi:MAG TPA: hypothetical protein VEF76_00955 [Patescibacteria group bacterium]|nr:hypothetical protein [Patescibacteria group bacterium]